MIVLRVRNVHQAYYKAMHELMQRGIVRDSRNGPVIMFPEPVTTVYEDPLERWVLHHERDANPFFHFAEALWMLAGRRDVDFLTGYVGRMKDFSDDGQVFHGAYGYRWRRHFIKDQLLPIIARLQKNPDDRRQVLTMWDPQADLFTQDGMKDLPCNTHAYFSVACDGRLDMTVCNRSNDLVLGAYGANAVHFSYLQQFVADCLHREVGVYRQVSNNLHVYQHEMQRMAPLLAQLPDGNPYDNIKSGVPVLTDGMESVEEFLVDVEAFLQFGCKPGMSAFLRRVAEPVFTAHANFKDRSNPKRFESAIKAATLCKDEGLAIACVEWLRRREARWLDAQKQKQQQRAMDDGVWAATETERS